MKSATLSSLTDDGIELLTSYRYQHHNDMPSFDPPLRCSWMDVELEKVEILIDSSAVDILDRLNEKQRYHLLRLIYDKHEDVTGDKEYENGLRVSDHI